jgi:hypothetical protein
MKLLRLVLICLALGTSLAHAESSGSTWKPAPVARWRKAGIGLIIGGGTCLALGAIFIGQAAEAANDALAGMQYHPESDDARINYQIAGGAFFIAGAAATISGLVLLW